MRSVFKYCDLNGIEILKNLELKITPPDQFNDPFEFTPQVICTSPNRRLKEFFANKVELRDFFQDLKSQGFHEDFRTFKRRLKAGGRQQLVEQLGPYLAEIDLEIQKNFLKHASKFLGVLCMSSRSDSIVMWGHYCDKHRGIVIEFDGSWEMFHAGNGLHEVRYERERALWDTSWRANSTNEREFPERLVFNKNADWSYEQELRQLYTLRSLKQKEMPNGETGYFLPVPPKAILSVTLGVRATPQTKNNLDTVLDQKEFAHVRRLQASLHNSDYSICIH